MKSINIQIITENSAFGDYPTEEIARILHNIANKIENGIDSHVVMDYNGNTCGSVTYTDDY